MWAYVLTIKTKSIRPRRIVLCMVERLSVGLVHPEHQGYTGQAS